MDYITHADLSPAPQWVKNERMAGYVRVYSGAQGVPPAHMQNTAQAGHDFGHVLRDVAENDVGAAQKASADNGGAHGGKTDGFGFLDVVDMINPLQHIPVVNILYRAISGDEIKPISAIIGGAVFGGVVGAAGNLIGAVIQDYTGENLADTTRGIIGMRGHDRKDGGAGDPVTVQAQRDAYMALPPSLRVYSALPQMGASARPDMAPDSGGEVRMADYSTGKIVRTVI